MCLVKRKDINIMHWDALKWAYESKFPKTIKRGPHAVLVALAYSMHPETKRCNPSLDRLCDLTRLESGAVKSALKILKKENLIAISSGKRKRISNDYVINFSIIPKKAKSNSDATTKTNETSTLNSSIHSTPTHIPTASNSTPSTPELMDSYAATISYADRFDEDLTPFNAKKAFTTTMEYFGKQAWYTNGGEKIWEEWISSIQCITDFIAFLPNPTVKDVEKVFKMIKSQRHWEALKNSILTLREKYGIGSKIKNWRSYSLTILKNDLSDCDDPTNS